MALTEEALEQISPHVAVIHNATNIGVVESPQSVVLVDSGSDDDAAKHILRIIQKRYPQKQLEAAINTHSHADHAGGNDYLVRHTGCGIWAPFEESKSIELPRLQSTIIWGGRPFRDIETKFYQTQRGTHVSKIISGTFYGEDSPTATDKPTVTMTAVPRPGHYFDQAGILVHDNGDGKKVFFLGDALFGVSIIKKYWIPFLYDVGQFRTSLETIENTDADFYIPSHGEIYTKENIHEIVEMNKLTTLETEELILRILKAPHTAEELLKEVADYASITLGMGQYVLIGCTLRSYLSCLYNDNKVKFEIADNRMLWKTV